MEVILSSFWTWLGTLFLVTLVGEKAVCIIEAVREPKPKGRRVKVTRFGAWCEIEITEATDEDVKALAREGIRRNVENLMQGKEPEMTMEEKHERW